MDCRCSHMKYNIELQSDDILYPFLFITSIAAIVDHYQNNPVIFF
jgi:hypothetical protein